LIDYIYANGCSYVAGAGLQDNPRKTAIHFLAEELNCEYFNNAKGGGSNQRIVRTTIDWLLKNKDRWNEVLVLIGWTGVLRYEILLGKEWIQINSIDREIEFLGKKIPTTDFWKLYLKNFNNIEEMFSKYLDSILYLQLFLESNNIKYIFWNTFFTGPFGLEKKHTIFNLPMEKLKKKNIDKWNIINKEYWATTENESWEKYLNELEKEHDVRVGTRDKQGILDDYHPNELGHKFWYEEIKNKAKKLSYI